MKFKSTVVAEFDAAHAVEGHFGGGNHGHAWEVSVTVEGGLDPKTIQVVASDELRAALWVVIGELANRDLNDMLPGIVTTPEGLALYIRERLILDWPRIVNVTVKMGDWAEVSIEGDIR